MSRPFLVVGPRSLPADGMAEVWIDSGSGFGYVRPVPVNMLALAAIDGGDGEDAIYQLQEPSEGPAGSDPAGQERNPS